MKSIFQFLFLSILAVTDTIPLFAQWVKNNGRTGASDDCAL
jgi:hypothetical protein